MKTVIVIVSILFSLIAKDSISIVTEHMPPYQYCEGSVVRDGLGFDIVSELMVRVDDRYYMKSFPWEQAYSLGLKKENVMIYSIVRNKEREKLFKWVGRIATTEDYFWKMRDNDSVKVADLEDAKRYRIATPRDDNQHIFLRNNGFRENVNMFPVRDMNQCIQMMYLGRMDLAIAPELLMIERTKSMGLNFDKMEKLIAIDAAEGGLYVAFSLSTSDEIVDRYRNAYLDMVNDGTYEKILQKWLSKE